MPPLLVDRFVPVFSETRASGATRTVPSSVPQTIDVTAGQNSSPNEAGNQPKMTTPRHMLDPSRMPMMSRGRPVRSLSGMVSTPWVSMPARPADDGSGVMR